MRSGNPVLGGNTFLDVGSGHVVTGSDQAMTINGTVNKTGLLLVLLVATAAFTWDKASGAAGPGAALPWLMTGAIGGLVVALITVFKKEWSPVTAPAYALLEGLFIGAFSAMMEARFPGIVLQAVGLTFGTLASLLVAYRSGLIRVTENFKLGVVPPPAASPCSTSSTSRWVSSAIRWASSTSPACSGSASAWWW